MTMTKRTWWDEHTDKVSHRSPRWAATDRGWLFARRGADATTTLGHYLDYGPCGPHFAADHNGCTVHAVSCVTPSKARPGYESAWCASVADAKAWIEALAEAQLAA
jgi:hypothetical protein